MKIEGQGVILEARFAFVMGFFKLSFSTLSLLDSFRFAIDGVRSEIALAVDVTVSGNCSELTCTDQV